MHNKQIYDLNIATDRIKRYCSIQDRCQWDVINKMNEWSLGEKIKNHLLEVLITENYINEERFSQSFCRGKFKIKNWGKRKINNELKQKNISKICIDKGMKEINEEEYLKVLDRLFIQKRDKITDKNHFVRKAKIANFLIQRGFESFLVWEKMKDLKDK
ncbi:RecX family transcriptional regulator [Flavobacteriales bacterium]|nr:RecX family transcriptional regulator [Flavobacteriales bacterium]